MGHLRGNMTNLKGSRCIKILNFISLEHQFIEIKLHA
jgi:hypothetical protein